jgi:hypothetical protein
MKKKTYGQTVLEYQDKNIGIEDDVIEYRRSMEKELLENIYQTAQNAKDQDLYKNKDFYVVMLMKVERIGQSPRTMTLARRSCPTPVYKQSVWKYMHNSGTLEFLWSIPDKIMYYHILHNKAKYIADKETADIAKFVILMEDGDLLKWVKKENGEKVDAVIKINEEH